MALIGREAPRPFRRMPYAEAIAQIRIRQAGPALRDGDRTTCPRRSPSRRSRVFRDAIAARRRGARLRRARRRAKYSRRELDELVEQAKQLGAAGLVWARAAGRRVQSSALKAAGEDGDPPGARDWPAPARRSAADGRRQARRDRRSCSGSCGCTSPRRRTCSTRTASSSCGSSTFRCSSGSRTSSAGSSCTTRSPSPLESDADLLESRSRAASRARAYDLVLNGSEIGGGSIRIHDQALQRLIFKLLQISDEEAQAALRLLPRRARIRHAAARRHRARPRPHRRDPVRRDARSATSSRSRRPPRRWT